MAKLDHIRKVKNWNFNNFSSLDWHRIKRCGKCLSWKTTPETMSLIILAHLSWRVKINTKWKKWKTLTPQKHQLTIYLSSPGIPNMFAIDSLPIFQANTKRISEKDPEMNAHELEMQVSSEISYKSLCLFLIWKSKLINSSWIFFAPIVTKLW